MLAQITISVIIPLFKVEQYIERCIDSVVCQTYSDIEIVLVDDKSPDKSLEMALRILRDKGFPDKRIKFLIHNNNRGLSAARNSGIDISTGEYIYFLDSDDAITKDAIERLVESIVDSGADCAVGNVNTIRNEQSYVSRQYANDSVLESEQIIKQLVDGRIPVMAWNKLIKRCFLIHNKLYFKEGLTHEDELWTFMVATTAQRLTTIKEPTYIYYIRKGSITTDSEIIKLENAISIFGEMLEYAECKKIHSGDINLYLNRFAYWRYYSIVEIKKLSFSKRYRYYKRMAINHKKQSELVQNGGLITIFLRLPDLLGFSLFFIMAYAYKAKVKTKKILQ